MTLTKSNKLGEDIYKKEVFYIDTKDLTESLYSEPSRFQSTLSRDFSKRILDEFDTLLDQNQQDKNRKKKHRKKTEANDKSFIARPNMKMPVISFFSDKSRVLGLEIGKINLDIEIRKKIHRKSLEEICKNVKEIRRFLQEISLYSPGSKHSIDIRRLDLERELLGLHKEKRISKIGLWKDLVFLRRELREIIFEYSALKRMAELVEDGGNNELAK